MTKTVVVTGGGDSVGRCIAEKQLKLGAKVFICDVNEENLQSTLNANPGMRGALASVGDEESVDAFFGTVNNETDTIDVLVNTVGIGGPRGLVEQLDMVEWRAAFAANVDGLLQCMQHAIHHMKRQRSGAILNFSSASTRTGLPSRTAYIATKYAVEGITKNAARELGPFNVRCNAVLPGVIDNERMRGIFSAVAKEEGKSVKEVEARLLDYVSMRTKISPEEIAEFVVFLTSDQAPHVTGQLIGLDGNLEWEV